MIMDEPGLAARAVRAVALGHPDAAELIARVEARNEYWHAEAKALLARIEARKQRRWWQFWRARK